MFCEKCGTKLHPSNKFCPKCGQKVDTNKNVDIRQSNVNTVYNSNNFTNENFIDNSSEQKWDEYTSNNRKIIKKNAFSRNWFQVSDGTFGLIIFICFIIIITCVVIFRAMGL